MDKSTLIRASTDITTQQLLHAVHISDNDVWKLRLCEALDPHDLTAIDVLYHKSYWLRHVFHTKRDNTLDERDKISRIAAEVEIVEELKRLLEQGTVLSMRDAESLYIDTLKEKGILGLC